MRSALFDHFHGFLHQRRFADAGRSANENDSVAGFEDVLDGILLGIVEPVPSERFIAWCKLFTRPAARPGKLNHPAFFIEHGTCGDHPLPMAIAANQIAGVKLALHLIDRRLANGMPQSRCQQAAFGHY